MKRGWRLIITILALIFALPLIHADQTITSCSTDSDCSSQDFCSDSTTVVRHTCTFGICMEDTTETCSGGDTCSNGICSSSGGGGGTQPLCDYNSIDCASPSAQTLDYCQNHAAFWCDGSFVQNVNNNKNQWGNIFKHTESVEDLNGYSTCSRPDNFRLSLSGCRGAGYMYCPDGVQEKTLKFYIAYKRIKNFACVEVHPQSQKLYVYVKLNPDEVNLEEDFARDVRNVGHYGTGDLEITIRNKEDLAKAEPLILRSYEGS